MFWVRLRSSIILAALALVTMLYGGWLLLGVSVFLSVAAYGELCAVTGVRRSGICGEDGPRQDAVKSVRADEAGDALECGAAKGAKKSAETEKGAKGRKRNGLETAGIFGVFFYYILLGVREKTGFITVSTAVLLCIVLVFMAELFVYVFAFPKFRAHQVTAAFFSFVYGPVCLSFIYLTRQLRGGLSPENSAPAGLFIVWLILLSSWGCDTCAYCVGILAGKHKMSPLLSPKKSVEGAVGGVLGASFLGALYGYFVRGVFGEGQVILFFALICGAGSLISMVGDLAASAMKRNAGIKDYGKLIPGHGGIMDRFDSVIFTAPVIYFMAVLIFQ